MSSATSTTKSAKPVPQRVFATLRLSGDRLDPERISAILQVLPTKAWRRGERYFAGANAGFLVGRTGTWFLATDDAVASAELDDHLNYLADLLGPGRSGKQGRLEQLRELMTRDGLRADFSCFWRGKEGEKLPTLPSEVAERLRGLPARIETDFDTDASLC